MQNNQGRGKGYQPKPNSLRRRTNARNVSFRISLRWPIYIINSVDKTKLSCNTPHRRSTVFRNLPPALKVVLQKLG